jgi:hypothetical protein
LRSLLSRARITQAEIKSLVDPSDAKRLERATSIEDLTFGEYVRAFSNHSLWEKLRLTIEPGLFVQRLREVQDIRNSVMHFHPDGISDNERELLSKTRAMLQAL